MKKTLIVVDMQNDFIDMALGTAEAVAIVPAVKAKIEAYAQAGHEIIYTRDTHSQDYLQTPEGEKLPIPIASGGPKGGRLPKGCICPAAGSLINPISAGLIGMRWSWRMWS